MQQKEQGCQWIHYDEESLLKMQGDLNVEIASTEQRIKDAEASMRATISSLLSENNYPSFSGTDPFSLSKPSKSSTSFQNSSLSLTITLSSLKAQHKEVTDKLKELEDFDAATKSIYSNISSTSSLITTAMDNVGKAVYNSATGGFDCRGMDETWLTDLKDLQDKKLNEAMSKIATLDENGDPIAYNMDEINKLLHKGKCELTDMEYLALMKIILIMPVEELEKLLNKGFERDDEAKTQHVTEVMKEVQRRLDALGEAIVNTNKKLTDEQEKAIGRAALVSGVMTDIEENAVSGYGYFITLKEGMPGEEITYTAKIHRTSFDFYNPYEDGRDEVYEVREVKVRKWASPSNTQDYVCHTMNNMANDSKKDTNAGDDIAAEGLGYVVGLGLTTAGSAVVAVGGMGMAVYDNYQNIAYNSRVKSNVDAHIASEYFEVLGMRTIVVETKSGVTLKYKQADMQELQNKINAYNNSEEKDDSKYPDISGKPENIVGHLEEGEFKILEPFKEWTKDQEGK